MQTFTRFIKKLIRTFLPSEEVINWCWHLPIQIAIAVRYGLPGRQIKVIGVAGTKGKTTTAHLISQLLEKTGEKTALYSTATIKVGDTQRLNDLKMTTPGRTFLHAFLRDAVRQKCTYAVLEVSSHGLKQFRLWGIPFYAVVLTNMMPDHLDYHKTAQDYVWSHMRMISERTRAVIVNGDDPNLEPFMHIHRRFIMFGAKQSNAISFSVLSATAVNQTLDIAYYGHAAQFVVPFPGQYNAYNATAALATLYAFDVKLDTLYGAVAGLQSAPGRFEPIENNQGKTVIVDYAHSPESFENFLQTVRPVAKQKLIAVTGACGDRDARVRPDMGRILANYCDAVVITNDDPYTEDPEKIMAELISGLTQSGKMIQDSNWWKIPDRKSAIAKAVSYAQKGDTVVVLGKGAEQWQVFKDQKVPWDDRAIIREILG